MVNYVKVLKDSFVNCSERALDYLGEFEVVISNRTFESVIRDLLRNNVNVEYEGNLLKFSTNQNISKAELPLLILDLIK